MNREVPRFNAKPKESSPSVKPVRAIRVIADHPVPKRLAVHAGGPGGFLAAQVLGADLAQSPYERHRFFGQLPGKKGGRHRLSQRGSLSGPKRGEIA